MDDRTPRPALASRARLGEGPWWDAEAGALWWVDILNRRVHRFRPGTGEDEFWGVGDVVGCAIPARRGRVLVGLRHAIALLDPSAGTVQTLTEVEADRPRNRLNDGRCDARGRLWVGSMSQDEGEGALYRFDPVGGLRTVETGLTVSDGLAVDAEGGVWSAQFAGGCVIRFAPDGRETRRVAVPVSRPTSCAFAGADRRDLFITTASAGLEEEELDRVPESGDLFHVRVGVAGLPLHRFRD
jgi:sugar lactone lactonase YvrE